MRVPTEHRSIIRQIINRRGWQNGLQRGSPVFLSQHYPRPFPLHSLKSCLKLSQNSSQWRRRGVATPIRNPRPNTSVPEADAPIATKESDDRALALITAREPQHIQKPQQKQSTLNIKIFSGSTMSGSRKLKESESPRAGPDLAASGFSLGGLAKILGDAAEAGNLPLVASMLKLGSDVNYSSRKEEECHYAATRGVTSKNDHGVEYLLKKGMNKKSAASALHQAIIRGDCIDIAMKLVPHADFNFMWAVKGDGDKTQRVLSSGSQPDER